MDKKEFKTLLKEYKQGEKKNTFELGMYLHENKKYKKAIKFFEEHIELKNYIRYNDVRKILGDYYFNGLGAKKDISKAMSFYKDVTHLYPEIRILVIKHYYSLGEYEKIIYDVERFADKDIEAMKFCYEYHKKYNTSKALEYGEKIVAKQEDKEIALELIDRYERYYLDKKKNEYISLLKKYSTLPEIAYKLGRMYYYGINTDVDYELAYKYFQAASRKGITDARVQIGYFYYKGYKVEQNTKKALEIFNSIKTDLSNAYLYRVKVETNEKITFFDLSDFEKAIETCPEAAAYVARLKRENKFTGRTQYTINKYISDAVYKKIPEGYLESGIDHFNKKEYEKAYKDLKYAHDRGVTEANIYLSKLVKKGLGCDKDEKFAKELQDTATDINSIFIKAEDLIKEKKDKKAVELLISIMDKHEGAKFEIATRYLHGITLEKDEKKGFKLLSEIYNKDYKYRYEYLKCLYYGIGTQKDYKKFSQIVSSYLSQSRYDKEKLDKELDFIVGEALYKGNGLKQDTTKALKFLEYSKDAKYNPAIVLYTEITNKLNEQKRIEEEKRKAELEARKIQQEMQKAIERAKEAEFNRLFEKYKDYRISIPEVRSIYGGYGALGFVHEVDKLSKTSTIVVKGTMNYSIYLSHDDQKNISEEIFKYVKKYVEEFYNKYPDYPLSTNIKHEFTIWHNC